MLQNDPNQRFEFEDRPVAAVFSVILVLLLILTYSIEHGLLGGNGKVEPWLMTNAYSLPKATALLAKKDYGGMMLMGYNSTFASFDMIQMAFNMYFFWVFGKHVEVKLGVGRYLLLILLGIYVPIIALHYDVSRTHNDFSWITTSFLASTIIGAYIVFPPIPKSKIGRGETGARPKNEIFRKGGRPDPLDKYVANPYMFVLTFAVIQFLLHYWVTMQKEFWIFKPMPGVDILAIIPMVAGAAIGYVMGWGLQQQANAALQESPMTLAAVKRYHELVDLDVCHDDALKGTARTLGVPYDKVKEWVAKNKGSMRIK